MGRLLPILLLFPVIIGAEQPAIRIFTTEDGLVRNSINSIYRDNKGRLWFCTVEGLSLYDGERFANYTTADGLPNRMVLDIADADRGAYWLATGGGLFRFWPRKLGPPKFEPVPLSAENYPEQHYRLFRMRNGTAWLGTDSAIYRLEGGDKPTATFVPVPELPRWQWHPGSSFTEDGDGNLWMSVGKHMVRRDRTGRFSVWSCEPARWLGSLFVAQDGKIWAGGDAICSLDLKRAPPSVVKYDLPLSSGVSAVTAFYQSGDGNIWIGANRGLVRFRPDEVNPARRFGFLDPSSVLGVSYLLGFTEDTAGNLWMGAETLGAVRLMRPYFSVFSEADGLDSHRVITIFEAPSRKLYAITQPWHALNEFDGERWAPIRPRFPAFIKDPTELGWGQHTVTLQDRRGVWWMASSHGLLRYPPVSRVQDLERTDPLALYRRSDGLPGEVVLRLFEDHAGGIWIGLNTGVARWDPVTESIQDFTPQLVKLFGLATATHAFAEDREGNIWIGLYRDGLVRYRQGRFDSIRDDVVLGTVTFLLPDRKGRLWVGSSRAGVVRIDEPDSLSPRLRHYTLANGLRSNHVYALTEDHYGRIYVAGGRGIDTIDAATDSVQRFASSALPRGEVEELFCDHTGAIWFGSSFGLTRYVPGPDTSEPPGHPTIREVRVSGVPILLSDEGEAQVSGLKFAAGKDAIEIAYGAVDFSVGNRVRYRYRLSPIEKQWREPSPTRSVQYAGIGAGSYRFEVQSVDSTGNPGTETASVSFRINAPFWRTGWFLTGAGLFVAGLVYAAHLHRVRTLLALERVRSRVAADLHDDLGSGLVEIAILTEVGRRKPHGTELETAARRARELRGALGDIVWAVDPSADNLEDLIRRCRQAAFALFRDEDLDFIAPPPEEMETRKLTAERRRNMLLLFKEAASNAARHSHASRVSVVFRLENGWLQFEVRDNGQGFIPEQTRCGKGLDTMAQRAQALSGKLEIRSIPDRGTTVHFCAPLM